MVIDRGTSASRRRGIGWQAIVYLLLLAFAFQSYLTQTHIHGTAEASPQACVSKCIAHTPLSQSPFDKATNCPLCQAIVHAGAFFVPAVLTFFVPYLWIESVFPATKPVPYRIKQARYGLSRAPPR